MSKNSLFGVLIKKTNLSIAIFILTVLFSSNYAFSESTGMSMAISQIVPKPFTDTKTISQAISTNRDIPVYMYHYNKGTVTEGSKVFGDTVWTVITGDRAILISEFPDGYRLLELVLSYSSSCIASSGAVCLDGLLTKQENSERFELGDEFTIILDPKNNSQTISILNESLYDTNIELFVEWIHTPGSSEIARLFTKSTPTFSFDGIPETLKLVQKSPELTSYPAKFLVEVHFDSRQGGFGDRTGQVLTQVITPHTMVIEIVGFELGIVTSAVLDNTWNVLTQSPISS